MLQTIPLHTPCLCVCQFPLVLALCVLDIPPSYVSSCFERFSAISGQFCELYLSLLISSCHPLVILVLRLIFSLQVSHMLVTGSMLCLPQTLGFICWILSLGFALNTPWNTSHQWHCFLSFLLFSCRVFGGPCSCMWGG